MTWFGVHFWSAAWLFLLIPPLILFYFLKLRRPRQTIPSLVLWRQVVNDSRVNSPFQRFKRNILLWLQLLLLILIVLAAMQPYWLGTGSTVDRLPVLIDTSASMGALDAKGKSRLEVAKARVEKLIGGMLPHQEMAIVTFSHTAAKRLGFTSNKKLLRETLATIELDDTPSDIEGVLRLTQAMSRSVPFETVLLLSDGNFPPQADFNLPFTLDYQRLPPAAANFGITSLNARRNETGWTLFARIDGSAGASNSATIEVKQNGTVVNQDDVTLSADQPERLVYHVDGESASTIEMELITDRFDALESDNYAYLDLPATRPMSVYVDADLYSVRKALKVMPDVHLVTTEPETGSAEKEPTFDVIITAQPENLISTATVTLYISHIPEDLTGLAAIDRGGTKVVDWQLNAPLLQHVELNELLLIDRPHSLPKVIDADYETLDYTILAHAERGPLLLEKVIDKKINYYLLFHPDNSTLAYRIAFPIMMSNLISIAMTQTGLAEARGLRTGVLPPVHLAAASATYIVEGPGKKKVTVASDINGTVNSVRGTRVGQYRYTRNGNTERRIGVSLLNASETSLNAVEELSFNELSVTATTVEQPTDRALWPLLSMLGLVVLLVEWWFFQRRRGVSA